MSKATNLIQRALHPGADLSHYPHPCPVDALHALGRARDPIAATLLHVKFGQLDLVKFIATIREVVEAVFLEHDWHINDRNARDGGAKLSRAEFIGLICRQVAVEYLGEACAACSGRGFIVKQHQAWKACENCEGGGVQRDSTRARARALRYSHPMIVNVWGERLDAVLAKLRLIESDAMRGVHHDLKGIGRR